MDTLNHHLVFVYGTLKSGFRNHSLLANAKFLGIGKTAAEYTLYDMSDFPAVSTTGQTAIHGEIYQVNDDTFQQIDDLEGHPYYYHRIEIESQFGLCWIYVMDISKINFKPIIESGDWNVARRDTTKI